MESGNGWAIQTDFVSPDPLQAPDLPVGADPFAPVEDCPDERAIKVSSQQRVGLMIQDTHASPQSNSSSAESLKMLLDYAIVEGTQLRLPVFVLLLRMANLELEKSRQPEMHLNAHATPSLCNAEERVAS
jgi:hypothetical protein